jgi:hypothetical protein
VTPPTRSEIFFCHCPEPEAIRLSRSACGLAADKTSGAIKVSIEP